MVSVEVGLTSDDWGTASREGRELGSGGREGPKSLSSSESEVRDSSGRVERSAGGGAGPICWRRVGEGEVCRRLGDVGEDGSSASALRLTGREGGRVGPMAGMTGG